MRITRKGIADLRLVSYTEKGEVVGKELVNFLNDAMRIFIDVRLTAEERHKAGLEKARISADRQMLFRVNSTLNTEVKDIFIDRLKHEVLKTDYWCDVNIVHDVLCQADVRVCGNYSADIDHFVYFNGKIKLLVVRGF